MGAYCCGCIIFGEMIRACSLWAGVGRKVLIYDEDLTFAVLVLVRSIQLQCKIDFFGRWALCRWRRYDIPSSMRYVLRTDRHMPESYKLPPFCTSCDILDLLNKPSPRIRAELSNCGTVDGEISNDFPRHIKPERQLSANRLKNEKST